MKERNNMKKIIIAAVLVAASLLAFGGCKTESSPAPAAQVKERAPVVATPEPALPSPDATPPAATIIPREFYSAPEMTGMSSGKPAVYPGSIAADDVFAMHWPLLEWGGKYITGPSDADRLKCREEFHARGGKVEKTTLEWTVALHVVGNGTRLEVADVIVDPKIWPASFDEEVKRCLVDSLVGRGEDSNVVADFKVDYPMCFSGR